MYQIDVKDVEPDYKVTIDYADSMMGTYEMNLLNNRFVHVFGALRGIKSLNTPGHQLTKTDLKEFLEDHVKEANLRLSRGKTTGIKAITVDQKLVFEPKMITYETMPTDCIDLSQIHPKNEVRIKYGKPIYTEWIWNVKDNKYLEIRPERDGLIYHNTRHDPVTPEMLKSYLDMHVKAADSLLKEQEHCYIESIEVDGKQVFEAKMLQYGKAKKTVEKGHEEEPTMIYRIGRMNSEDKMNGWELIAAPSEEKAVAFAKRLFNQDENNERPYSFESPYEPVVLGTYKNKEEMGYGWKELTPIKANDKPMPYELELEKMNEKNKQWERNEKTIALDTETTGFNADDEVLQLSVLNGNGKTLFNEYFKPQHKTSWESAMKCNHITPEMVGDKKPITAYKEQIEKLLQNADRIVGYNTGFDMTMLNQNGIDLPKEKKYVDLMVPYADVIGQKDRYGKPKMQKLIACADHYGFKQDNDWHNSMADTEATMFCYHKMMEKGHLAEKDVKELSGLKNFKSREEQEASLKTTKTLGDSNLIVPIHSSKEPSKGR